MNPEDVGRVLDEIGERIGPAGEYAWQLTVRQVVIDAALWGALGVLCLMAAAACFVLIRRSDRNAIARGDTSDLFGWLGLLTFTAYALLPGLALVVFTLTQALNPEYHAMVRLLERLVP